MNIFNGYYKVIILILVFAVCLLPDERAYAGNGTRMIGFGARDGAMAGATTASAEDTSCLVRNPASLVRIGNRIDVEYQNIIPHDVTMHTEGALSRAGVTQKSTIDYIPGGNAGISYRLPWFEKYPISVGVGAFTMSGVAINYPSGRIGAAFLGNSVFDRMIDLRSVRVAPGMAVAITDKLSIGATGNIGIQALKTDLSNSSYQETQGGGRWDVVPGGGFTVGLLYQFNEMLALGASYESHGWFKYHSEYEDVLHLIDEPPVANVGVSLKPIKNLELTYDTRYIHWTNVKIAQMAPINGGFGWRDQWVFATGGEYTTFKDKLKLRLGYNYGRSQISRRFVFANALLPLIMEHHLTTGFSYFVTENLSLDFVWEHHFKAVKADNGMGDTYSINGNGTKVTAAVDIIGVGLGYKF